MNFNNKWYVMLNPAAGFGKGRKQRSKIELALQQSGLDFEMVISETRGHIMKLTKEAISKGYRKLCCVGGDGSLHEMVNGAMMQSDVNPELLWLSIIPVGTGNDWVHTYNFPKKLTDQIEVLKQERSMLQDIGEVHYQDNQLRYFVNFAGAGFDAFLVEKIGENKRGGVLAYRTGLIYYLFHYENIAAHIEMADKTQSTKLFMIAACIGKYAAGGLMLAPNAKPLDGKLDVTVVADLTKWQIIQNLPKLKDGSFIDYPLIEHLKLEELKIEGTDKLGRMKVQADGEILGEGPFHFKIADRKCRFVIP